MPSALSATSIRKRSRWSSSVGRISRGEELLDRLRELVGRSAARSRDALLLEQVADLVLDLGAEAAEDRELDAPLLAGQVPLRLRQAADRPRDVAGELPVVELLGPDVAAGQLVVALEVRLDLADPAEPVARPRRSATRGRARTRDRAPDRRGARTPSRGRRRGRSRRRRRCRCGSRRGRRPARAAAAGSRAATRGRARSRDAARRSRRAPPRAGRSTPRSRNGSRSGGIAWIFASSSAICAAGAAGTGSIARCGGRSSRRRSAP